MNHQDEDFEMFGSSMGKMTVEKRGGEWIVCEDGRRIGGTVRYPFESREAAQRYLDRELAAEAKVMTDADVGLSARCRVIRETDPEVWAKVEEIEKQFAGNDDAYQAAHEAAGTWIVMMKMGAADLEATGIIKRTGEMREGEPVFAVVTNNNN
jgi:hypothetical protein